MHASSDLHTTLAFRERNRMVDTYEEDFDPTEEIKKEPCRADVPTSPNSGMPSVYSGFTSSPKNGIEPSVPTSQTENSLNFDLLDDWLSASSTQPKVRLQSITNRSE